ncbi:MAG: TIGR02217 family protein [Rhizobiaceae bacterium]
MTELSSFHDVRFPTAVSFGATGGPERRNEIVQMLSGSERRNARFAHSRRRYDAGTGVRSIADIEDVLAFFEARRGSLHAFRFRDPFDMKSCVLAATPTALDQFLGVGDGATARFQLAKVYGSGDDAYRRPITRPVMESVMVAVAGEEKSSPAQFTVDAGTGEIVFAVGQQPAEDDAVTAGFEFDVPVRFDTDHLSISLSSFKAGQIPSIPLVEVAG